MAKSSENKKSKKTTATETSAPAPAPVPVVELAPAPAPVPLVEVASSPAEVETPVVEIASEILLQKVIAENQELYALFKAHQNTIKALQKELAKEHKEARKRQEKLLKKKSNKKASNGNQKLFYASPALQSFLGLENGVTLPRKEYIARVTAYVKENGLQDPNDKRKVIVNAPLAALFENGDKEVQLFTIQTFLKKHFTPVPVVESSSSSSSSSPLAV